MTFRQGTNLDTAQTLVQNRVAIAIPRLPQEVQRLGVVTKKTAPDILLAINLISPDHSLDDAYISNYAVTRIRDELLRVAQVQPFRNPEDFERRVEGLRRAGLNP